MKNIISLFTFLLFSITTYSQQDSTKPNIIYPVGTASDTVNIQAVVVTETNKVLVAKEYYVITDYFIFAKETGKNPEPFKQRVIEKLTGVIVNNFAENRLWSKVINKK